MNQVKNCKFLTVVVPTYNRKHQLIRLLKSLERQHAIERYYLVILDNHSDYDVKSSLSKEFSSDFIDNIALYRKPYNTGGDYNISSAFLYAKSDYMWIIGDDDEVLDGCFDIIEEDVAKYPDIPYFKYHNKGHSSYDNDLIIRNISEFEHYFKSHCFRGGDVIFVSNNVYNLKAAESLIPSSLYYSYCSIPHTLPMLRCLQEERPFVWSHREIVQFNAPENDHWDYVKIATSFTTVLDIHYGADYKVTQSFFQIISRHFKVVEFMFECLKVKDKKYSYYVCRKGLSSLFNGRFVYSRYCFFLFMIEKSLGLKLLTFQKRLLESAEGMKSRIITNNGPFYQFYKKHLKKCS